MKLVKKGAIATIGASAALVALSAAPAFATEALNPNPYAPPQNPTGVPYDQYVNVTATGLPVGVTFSAVVCDGNVPTTTPGWSIANNCGPPGGAQSVPSSGTLTFGGDVEVAQPTTAAFLLWHGNNASAAEQNNPFWLGEMPFNCLAPDDNPNGPTTAEGDQPIDNGLPSWGASSGGSVSGGGTAPCQILITENPNETSFNPATDVLDPLNLTAAPASPESPAAIALPVGAALLLGGGSLLIIRRRRRSHAVA